MRKSTTEHGPRTHETCHPGGIEATLWANILAIRCDHRQRPTESAAPAPDVPGRWRVHTISLPRILVEVCWRPMEGDEAGDFHDLVDLRTGRVGVAIGDVAGFGAAAAERAEELRWALRRAFRASEQPERVLELLDERVDTIDPDLFATLACAIVDPAAETIEIANAGHPPILSVAGSEAGFLNGLTDPPLGIGGRRRVVSYQQQPGTMLFFYTDGLIERRGTSIETGFEVLLESARGLNGTSGSAAQLTKRVTSRIGQPADDATVVSLRVIPLRPSRDGATGAASAAAAADGATARRAVTLRVYLDPSDLRSARTEAVVREVARRAAPTLEVEIEVVDVTRPAPEAATGEGDEAMVVAAPTVMRVTPTPRVQVVGGARSADELARALDLPLEEEPL